MTVEQIIALCGVVLGSGSAGTIAIQRLIERTGSAGQRRRDDLNKAWDAYDRERKWRRRIEDYTHQLRRMLIEAPCIDPVDLPPWPSSST
jgi:hypothetical protein